MWGVAVFLVALAVRTAHVLAIRDTPLFDTLLGDARAYDAWARRLAAGDWIGTDVFYQAPLYPYVLGLVYAVAGHDLLVPRLIQGALGAASAVFLLSAGTRLFSRRVGLLAGFGLALYAPAIFFDGLLQKSSLDVFFVCVVIWIASRLVERPDAGRWWLALGATLGGLALTRENALALVVVAAVWSVVASRWNGPARSRSEARADDRGSRARRDRHAGNRPVAPIWRPVLLACGLVIVLGPVALRNYAVGGGFYLTTSQFGPNFYIGNNPMSDGTYAPLRVGRGAPEFERQDATELAEAALGRPLGPAEVSAYWTDRALSFVTGEPVRWLALLGRKSALLWNRSEMLDTESQETYAEVSPILRLLAPVGHFGVLVPLALVGLVAAWPERRRLWPLVALAAAYAVSVVLFYVFARYRFPLVPFLVLFAALGADSARALSFQLAPPRRAVLAGAVLAVAVAVNIPMLSSSRMRAITETNLGTALHEAGRSGEAIARLEKAVALEPGYAPAYNNLGVALRATGRVDEAIGAYERGLALQGDYPDLHYNLANALLQQNRADEAAAHLRRSLADDGASAATHNNLGMALAEQGQHVQALAEFRLALQADPGSALAHRNLGNVLATLGRTDEAVTSLRQAVALAPGDADAAYDLGVILLEAGRYAEAESALRAALGAEAASARTLNNLGIAVASQGRLADAAALFERALAVEPGFADAERNLRTAREALKP